MVLLKRPNARCAWSRTFECWIVRDGSIELGTGQFSHDAWADALRRV